MRFEILLDPSCGEDPTGPLDVVVVYADQKTNLDYMRQWMEVWYGEALYQIKRI